jgi:hypothetical protein
MNEEELSVLFCVTPEEPWFRGVLAVLDGAIEDAVGISCLMQTATNPGHLAHAAGGVEALRTLREEVLRRRAEAFEVKAE